LKEKVDINHFISKKIGKSKVIRFLIKVWYPTHLYDFSKLNLMISKTPSWPNNLIC